MITGITGYLGMHVCKYFLEDGGFRVRGTTRPVYNLGKQAQLRNAFGHELFAKLEVVECDIEVRSDVDRAMKGAVYIVHTAS